MATPYATISRPEAASTQDLARDAFADGAGPVLVVAARQTAGRGRSGNPWWEAPRAMYASLAVEFAPDGPPPTLPVMMGLAVRDALRAEWGVEVALAWPNDLVTGEGKVGGILVEAHGDLAVCGCGVNLWWPEPPAGAAAVLATDPGSAAAGTLAAAWASRLLDRVAAARDGAWGWAEYRAACVTLGQEITWKPAGEGRAVDVASDGGLVVETASGTVTLRSGAVRMVRPRR
ncbi:MAG: biotin--[acetyl-CoA-carboxylase] ligase [Acidimicrobiia bacterium]|jgi:BirA family biotin operon repressor/biotin-[acetyl-CoA-carboxylase] ligase